MPGRFEDPAVERAYVEGERRARKTFAAQRALDIERQKTEDLLFNVLPPAVAQRLREGQAVADSFSDVSVVFIDIVGFSQLARRLSPGMLVKVLNEVFSIADGCADRSGVEKVKTIGDAYLAVAGGQASGDRGASEAIFRDQRSRRLEETRRNARRTFRLARGALLGGLFLLSHDRARATTARRRARGSAVRRSRAAATTARTTRGARE